MVDPKYCHKKSLKSITISPKYFFEFNLQNTNLLAYLNWAHPATCARNKVVKIFKTCRLSCVVYIIAGSLLPTLPKTIADIDAWNNPYKRRYEISSFWLISDRKSGSYLTYIPILSPKCEYVLKVRVLQSFLVTLKWSFPSVFFVNVIETSWRKPPSSTQLTSSGMWSCT